MVTLFMAVLGARSWAVDFSLEYMQVPAVYQFVQANVATGDAGQESKDASMPTFGLRVSQSLPQLFADWPLSFGFESGFGLPAGTSSFDLRQLLINSSALSANARNEGDSLENSILCVPIMATIGYTPKVSGVSIAGQAGVGVILMDVMQDQVDSVYTGPLDDLDYVQTRHTHAMGSALAVQLVGGLNIPVTETLSARLWGGAMWMSKVDYSTEIRQADGTTTVSGLQVGGVGFTVRVGLSSAL